MFVQGKVTVMSDPVQRQAGKSVVSKFSVKYVHNPELEKSRVSYFDCEGWEDISDNIQKFIKKGDEIEVEGGLKQDRWEDKNDQSKRTKVMIVIEKFQLAKKPIGNQRPAVAASKQAVVGRPNTSFAGRREADVI